MVSRHKSDKSDDDRNTNKDHRRSKPSSSGGGTSSKSKSTTQSAPRSVSAPGDTTLASSSVLLLCAFCVFVLNFLHTSSMFENDRRFSHLSTLEREMTFRTEMGFYYSHFKTLVNAPSFSVGIGRLMHNNITEYPSIINSLQRFNIIPEVVMAASYRSLMSFSHWLGIELVECWQVSRPAPMPPVTSCDGIGDPANFYVFCAWLMAGATASLVFLSGAMLSRSLLGGIVSAACFFFNHGEATRVMWAPPLRETFAFPFCLIVNLVITWVLRRPRRHYIQALYLAVICCAYLSCWQLSQYSLMVSLVIVYFFHTIELIPPLPMLLVLIGIMFGFANSLILMFFNKMLMTSLLAAAITAVFALYVFLENIFNYVPTPFNKSIQISFIFFSTFAMKLEIENFIGETEDSHVYNIVRAKFSNYSDFHTLLYTCSGEFDFLPFETIKFLSSTGLIPIVAMIFSAFVKHSASKMKENLKECAASDKEYLPHIWKGVDPGVVYNFAMLFVYCVLAGLIMRMKLFMTPQLCIMAALITNRSYFKVLKDIKVHYGIVMAVLAIMAVGGTKNIIAQRAIQGEYMNADLEELLEWTKTETTPNSVFAGTMPTMANLMLSTGRPIVNHPHYETADIRRRTKQVYRVFSRGTAQSVYETLLNMKANYVVLDQHWCFHRNKKGCGMVDLWDVEEPHNKKRPPLCPTLFNHSPAPFHRVFSNDGYVVLQVPSKYVQMPAPKSLKS